MIPLKVEFYMGVVRNRLVFDSYLFMENFCGVILLQFSQRCL